MALLGTLFSQQLGFTITTTAGTVYTHGLGFTPTVVILTINNTATPAMAVGYTAAGTNLITITANAATSLVDVLVGELHSIIQ